MNIRRLYPLSDFWGKWFYFNERMFYGSKADVKYKRELTPCPKGIGANENLVLMTPNTKCVGVFFLY
ncbi:MAG: hypothetical protein PHY73_00685 [Candidatus Omnitrophica bacterium]|nr:hypothetical protein [Candidatus Omnitrophota bacterium]